MSKVEIGNLDNARLTREQQRNRLDFLQSVNRNALEQRRESPELEGVIESFELGFRMQRALPEVMDIAANRRRPGLSTEWM